ncbi:MAG TPA: aminotransferase class V-fold PLP-dependent enzyme [Xanthobacteraceae bacterium]|jgi:isopenicillin-N epimerase|nr:aminotransferase class V-fold PLP-dependent enzyme [Xanthobacteraceae bacterium]
MFADISRDEWLLDPEVAFLNHGSFGATPRTVLVEQERWRARMERHPTHFMSEELPPALRAAAARLAAFVGSEAKDLVFVENATAGCNTVLRSIPLAPGDEILVTDHGYPAVRKAAEHAATRAGARVIEAQVPFPLDDPAQVTAAVAANLGPRTRLAVFDHVTSPTAVIFPVRELTALCRAAGALVLIDGAHGPGMLDLDVPAIGADWYTGNCHKWLMAPKGSGFLWTSPQQQAETHPLVISHGFGQGFTLGFDWIGTRDPTAWLSVPAAIDFHERLGGARLRERNAALAREQATALARIWNTERGAPDPLTGSMAAVRLPLSDAATPERAQKLRRKLFDDHRIEVLVAAFAGSLWARISAHAYNRPADYARLAACFRGGRAVAIG